MYYHESFEDVTEVISASEKFQEDYVHLELKFRRNEIDKPAFLREYQELWEEYQKHIDSIMVRFGKHSTQTR